MSEGETVLVWLNASVVPSDAASCSSPSPLLNKVIMNTRTSCLDFSSRDLALRYATDLPSDTDLGSTS